MNAQNGLVTGRPATGQEVTGQEVTGQEVTGQEVPASGQEVPATGQKTLATGQEVSGTEQKAPVTEQPVTGQPVTGQKVLVTGGTGYLARWCIRLLAERGYAVQTTLRDPAQQAGLTALFAAAGGTGQLRVIPADLRRDEGWTDAVAGCDYVLHVASPFPAVQPRDPAELIEPARDGTLRVLHAAYAADVRRIVVTSSSAAVRNPGVAGPGRPLTEDDWASLDNRKLSPYARSKVIAERAAWDHAEDTGNTQRLSVVNPGAIIGPLLGAHRSYSLQTIERLLDGAMPAIPRLGFAFSDVRDVADLHIRAMTGPAAAGQRFLGTGPFLWMADLAAILRAGLGQQAAKVPQRQAPNWLVRLMARRDPSARAVIGELGQRSDYSTEKARTLLGWDPRPVRDSVLDCARSLGSALPAPDEAEPAEHAAASATRTMIPKG